MKRTRMEKIRLSILCAFICLFFSVVIARLIHLQIFLQPKYSNIVDNQTSGTVDIPATRGIIYDRLGQVVASNVTRSSLYAYALTDQELNNVVKYLEKTFKLKPGTAKSKYGLKVKRFRWIKRRMEDELSAYVENSAPQGLYLREETLREYPYGTIGKQILGFTDIDNHGQSGIEMSYDSLLAGKSGKADIRRDGKRNLYRVKESAMLKPVLGKSLVLTIDWRLQEILENELKSGIEEFNAKGGMGAFIDCNTGEILAMAHYDPNEENRDKPLKLQVVTDQFEPGSIFKVFTAGGLLDANLVDFDDTTYCEMGKWKVGRRILHDDKEHGWLNFRQIIELSSNIGVGKYALELGGDKLYQTACDFGFGKRLNIGLGGETRGSVYCPDKWSDYTIAALAMGHSVAVNTLQMTTAFGAIANGGELLKPSLVLCGVNEKGQITDRCQREVINRVIKEESSDSLRSFLRGVVERGTATKVNSPAISIAGKTGTAEIPKEDGRGYYKHKFNASFAGFFPAEEPKIAGVIVLKDPKPVTYGGYTSGPIFRRIAESYLVLNPDVFKVDSQMMMVMDDEKEPTVEVPDFVGRSIGQVEARANENEIVIFKNADSGMVVWQYPPADRLIFKNDMVLVAVKVNDEAKQKMPDLRGLSVRQATAFLSYTGIKSRIKGSGRVIKQSILPGETVNNNTECWLECKSG
ncbi:MAG: penicillin-binding transpeptidase domain-containing protein [bacterium]